MKVTKGKTSPRAESSCDVRILNSKSLILFSCVPDLGLGIPSPGTDESGGGVLSRQQAHRHSPALPPAGGVCPRKRLKGCLSPDSVFLLILQNPARVVIILIYDQVSICVVARVKVGDHSGGDPQASHHCKKYRKSSVGCGSRSSMDSWT